jgi:hypothetical protein
MLDAVGIEYSLVVEPQDYNSYKANYPCGIFTLPENDRGITFARQHILDLARVMKLEWFWMLDDDINEFGEVVKCRTIRRDASMLCKAERLLTAYESSLYTLELRQFAWTSDELKKNRTAMQCVLFNVPRCRNINYDLDIKIREDYDLTFQSIFKANGTLKTAKYYYGIADMKSQEGGMEKWYNDEFEKKQVELLCKKYPGLVEYVYKKNRHDVKINWRKYKL